MCAAVWEQLSAPAPGPSARPVPAALVPSAPPVPPPASPTTGAAQAVAAGAGAPAGVCRGGVRRQRGHRRCGGPGPSRAGRRQRRLQLAAAPLVTRPARPPVERHRQRHSLCCRSQQRPRWPRHSSNERTNDARSSHAHPPTPLPCYATRRRAPPVFLPPSCPLPPRLLCPAPALAPAPAASPRRGACTCVRGPPLHRWPVPRSVPCPPAPSVARQPCLSHRPPSPTLYSTQSHQHNDIAAGGPAVPAWRSRCLPRLRACAACALPAANCAGPWNASLPAAT